MTATRITGLSGASPLGFLGALGLLRLLHRGSGARLSFMQDGSFHPVVEGFEGDLGALVADDAAAAKEKQAWWLEYEKAEKKGAKIVADLKAPPKIFSEFLSASIRHWQKGEGEASAYAAAFGTSVARDGKGNTKPTAFHFTAANQQFLGTLEEIRRSVTPAWAARTLFAGYAARPGPNLRWDPSAERNWALMASNPNEEGTSVDAPLEWLAFRALPLFPTFPRSARIVTTCVSGRGDEMEFTWPLWSVPISLGSVRSALQLSWVGAPRERDMRGVFAICTSAIRRTAQGFGNFGPATIKS